MPFVNPPSPFRIHSRIRISMCTSCCTSPVLNSACSHAKDAARQRVIAMAWPHLMSARRDAFKCATWRLDMCDMTNSFVWHDEFICVTWRIHLCDMTHSMCIHMCDMTHLYVWHNAFKCVTWRMHMCNVTQTRAIPAPHDNSIREPIVSIVCDTSYVWVRDSFTCRSRAARQESRTSGACIWQVFDFHVWVRDTSYVWVRATSHVCVRVSLTCHSRAALQLSQDSQWCVWIRQISYRCFHDSYEFVTHSYTYAIPAPHYNNIIINEP